MEKIDLLKVFRQGVLHDSRIERTSKEARNASPKDELKAAIQVSERDAWGLTRSAAFAYGVTAFHLQQELFELGEAEEVLDRTEINSARKEAERTMRIALSPGKPSTEVEILTETMRDLENSSVSVSPDRAFAYGYAAAEAVQELEKLEQSSDESLEKLPDERETRAGNILGPKISMY